MDNKEIICNGKTLGYAEGEMAMYLRDCERVIEIQADIDNYETH